MERLIMAGKNEKRSTKKLNKMLRSPKVFEKNILICCGFFLVVFFWNTAHVEAVRLSVYWGMLSVMICAVVGAPFFLSLIHKKDFFYKRSCVTAPLNSISTVTEISSKRVCAIREAGHAVMAYLECVNDYEVIMGADQAYTVVSREYEASGDISKVFLLEYAGIAAENVFFDRTFGSDQSIDQTVYAIARICRDNIGAKRGKESDDNLDALATKFYWETVQMIDWHKKLVERLADKLMDTDRMTKEEINHFLSEVV